MRHAQRQNLRNGAVVLSALLLALVMGGAVLYVVRSPSIVTVYMPAEVCVVPEPLMKTDEPAPLLSRIFKRKHRAAPVPTVPPVCPAPDAIGPRATDTAGETHAVPEPGTLALVALGMPFLVRRRG